MSLTVTQGLVVERDTTSGPPAHIRVTRGADSVDVVLDTSLTVGRLGGADVVVDAPTVSRVHCILTRTGAGVVVSDCGSHNGTFVIVDGERRRLAANERLVLREQIDVVDVGAALLRVVPATQARTRAPKPTTSVAGRRFEAGLVAAASTRLPVVLLGASGTGKTWAAKYLHDLDTRRGPFVLINCARLPSDPLALQSDLLGHKRGAYTGAAADHVGRLAWADGGTLLLDEVESMPPLAQGFLLDILDGTGVALPIGGTPRDAVRASFRLIAATKTTLASSGLRRDLSERLAIGHLMVVPSLEDRADDLPELVAGFADEQARLLGRAVVVDDDVVAAMARASWPGQLRQLRAATSTMAQTAAAATSGAVVVIDAAAFAAWQRTRALVFGDEASSSSSPSSGSSPVARTGEPARLLKREQIVAALEEHHGNHAAAARALGVARNTLLKRLKQFDIAADHGALKKV